MICNRCQTSTFGNTCHACGQDFVPTDAVGLPSIPPLRIDVVPPRSPLDDQNDVYRKRADLKDYHRRMARARRRFGALKNLCRHCLKAPPIEGQQLCVDCRLKDREIQRRYRRNHPRRNYQPSRPKNCVDCDTPITSRATRCQACQHKKMRGIPRSERA